MQAYIVIGYFGEYEDAYTKILAGFKDISRAKKFAENLNTNNTENEKQCRIEDDLYRKSLKSYEEILSKRTKHLIIPSRRTLPPLDNMPSKKDPLYFEKMAVIEKQKALRDIAIAQQNSEMKEYQEKYDKIKEEVLREYPLYERKVKPSEFSDLRCAEVEKIEIFE